MDVLERLNGFSSFEALIQRGRLLIPDVAGNVLSLEVGNSYRPREVLVSEYWAFHPRYKFFKTLAPNTHLIDIGAGSGGLVGWKAWGDPDRTDLSMYAIDITKGELFDLYTDFDVVKLGENESKFPAAAFDAAILSHVIEHIEDSSALAKEVSRVCKPRSKIYVEWPNAHTSEIVGRDQFASFGIACSTINFFDDDTHLRTIPRAEAKIAFERAGFRAVSEGNVVNDFLYPELFRCGVTENDAETTTYALWLALRFSQYMIMEKD